MDSLDRRLFLKGAGAALAAGAIAPRAVSAATKDPASIVPGKDPRLIVHTARPPVFETPPALLAGQQVTPTSLFFVRNCQVPPQISGDDPLSGWKIELAGKVDRPQTFDAKVLRDLEREEVEMVVQCSGNGRALFSQASQTEGSQWLRGGMGNVRFAGVRLSRVLDHLKVKPSARYLTAEGRDEAEPPKGDFEHSLPVNDVLARSLLALELNGQPLPVIHGGPVRLITPGFYGTMHVKWVTRLRFEDDESDHWSQVPSYRTPLAPIAPGTAFKATYDNSEPNYRMRLKSVVLTPSAGEKLSSGKLTVQGVAFNDGDARIDSVAVSTDRGRTWQRADLEVPESPYAWYRWQIPLQLSSGKHEIWSRATDALGRTQPLEGSVYWNPKGYTWNGVEKIAVTVG